MSDANTSAPAETGDLDLSAAADMVPDDVFDLPEDLPAEHPEGETAPVTENTIEEEAPAAEPIEGEPQPEPEETETTSEEPQTVTIGGKAIPLEEVERGFLRQADYTRKTQEVAAERQTLQNERETITHER